MHMKPDPMGTPRHPLVVYLLCLAAISGLRLLFGLPAADSVEAELGASTRMTWAIMLTAGSTVTLMGMFWPGDPRDGLLLKRWGYLALSIASGVYGLVLFARFGMGSLLLGATLLGFAGACGIMVRRINRAVKVTLP